VGSSPSLRGSTHTLGVSRVLRPKKRLAAKMLNADSIKRPVINAMPLGDRVPLLQPAIREGKDLFRASPGPHPAGASCQGCRLCETMFT